MHIQRIPYVASRVFVAWAGALALLLPAWPLRAAPGLQPRAVAPGVWFVQGEAALGSPANRNFISNAAFVVTGDGVVVIDALGSPALAEELLQAIRRVTPQPVRQLIVTHYHADHVYGLQVFKAAGVEVVAHRAAREYLGSDAAQRRLEASRQELAPWIGPQTVLVGADRYIDGDTVVELGGERLHVRHAGPAHTPEDLVVFAERAQVLFAGDLVFRGRIPFVGQADSRGWTDALDRLIALKPRLIVPGHGPVSADPVPDLELTRSYLLYLRQRMGEAAAQLEPFDEAYARTDWRAYAHLPLFRAANRINAYNTYLLMEQQGR
jgi:glyoxylase-like metal-dependent hydrolase (beta-lactamase superfamily II)